MRFVRFVRRHPLVLLGGIAVAFVGWVWWDAIPAPPWGVPEANPVSHGETLEREPAIRRLRVLPPDVRTAEGLRAEATTGLAKLKPGMPRAEVEKLVGPPAAEHVYPATVADGRVTYQAAYEADLGPPPTVRPIRTQRLPVPREPDSHGRMLVTLEFDATKPGHPLVGIHYPDPLF
ncbi:MAG: hypothetical protein J0I06_10770 [Planctomycetes bacterium]|nr:hypothetical protein [Planctomycetota bacterium]